MAKLSPQWLSALRRNAWSVEKQAEVGALKAEEELLKRVKGRAMATPRWSELSDNIELWSQDGRLIIGVRDQEFQSQAFALEYGDEINPPSPLLRTLQADVQAAGSTFTAHMEQVGMVDRFGSMGEMIR